MAFNNVGHFWLKKDEGMWVNIYYGIKGVGTDHGAQWIMADPKPFDTFPTPSGTTALESGRFIKQVIYANGGTDWTYWSRVTNVGSLHTWFCLQGGGNV